MNVDEFTTELQRRALAGQAGAGAAPARVAGAKRRAAERRRRRVTGAVVATVLVVLAGAGVAAVVRPAPDPTVPAEQPAPLPADINRWRVWDRLVSQGAFGGGIGTRSSQAYSFNPRGTNLAVVGYCHPDAANYRPGTRMEITVNGVHAAYYPCLPPGRWDQLVTPFRFSADAAANSEAWQREALVRPGRKNVLRARYLDAAGRLVPGDKGIDIGAGLFGDEPVPAADQEPLRFAIEGGGAYREIELPARIPAADGGTFALSRSAGRQITRSGRSLTLDVPPGAAGPVRVRWGVAMEHLSRGTLMRLLVDGRPVKVLPDGGIDDLVTVDGGVAHRLELRVDPGIDGAMLLSVYRLER